MEEVPQKQAFLSRSKVDRTGGGLLYVIRGFSSDGECLQSSEVYNPGTNQWSLMDDCPDRPDFHRAFAFSFKSKLFVVGGNIKNYGHGKLS